MATGELRGLEALSSQWWHYHWHPGCLWFLLISRPCFSSLSIDSVSYPIVFKYSAFPLKLTRTHFCCYKSKIVVDTIFKLPLSYTFGMPCLLLQSYTPPQTIVRVSSLLSRSPDTPSCPLPSSRPLRCQFNPLFPFTSIGLNILHSVYKAIQNVTTAFPGHRPQAPLRLA